MQTKHFIVTHLAVITISATTSVFPVISPNMKQGVYNTQSLLQHNKAKKHMFLAAEDKHVATARYLQFSSVVPVCVVFLL